MSESLYESLRPWTRGLPGGLLHTNIVACAIFAACSGSSTATASAVASVAYPEQIKQGYNRSLVVGSLAAGGTLGILIPPSIPLIIYGGATGESVGRLFAAGMFPGLIMAALFSAYIAVWTLKQRFHFAPSDAGSGWKERMSGLKNIWGIILLIVAVLGGIYSGVVTPTEAAGVGVVVAMILAIKDRRLNWKTLRQCFLVSLKSTSMIFLIILGASLLSTQLGYVQAGATISSWIASLNISPLAILAMVCVMYLILGCFFDPLSMMIITISTVYPLMISAGFDGIWFGVILVILIEAGNCTPPVGLNVYIIKLICKEELNTVFRGSLPFVVVMMVSIVLFTAVPQLVSWLPSMLYK